MLRGLLASIVEDRSAVVERDKGVAFLFAAREIYQLSDILYFCVNIPRRSSGSFVHCAFSGEFASQAITTSPIPAARLAVLDIVKLSQKGGDESAYPAHADRVPTAPAVNGEVRRISALPLAGLSGEVAIIGMLRDPSRPEGEEGDDAHALAELKILGTYFHSHMLRRNGVDASQALVISARELDCLRWMAAGKSAWEASVILGISERTVRFHLNSAREKLDCTTTTQAVAKVVAQQLIAV
jgi:DNA-binding CsgD family transcriptional regulator